MKAVSNKKYIVIAVILCIAFVLSISILFFATGKVSGIVYKGHMQNIRETGKVADKVAKELIIEFVPKDANDIRYSVLPYRQWLEIMFSISEPEFQSWISEKKDWKLTKINTSDWNSLCYKADDGSKKEILIKSKCYYEGKRPKLPESSIRIAYDEDQHLCYLRYSSGM